MKPDLTTLVGLVLGVAAILASGEKVEHLFGQAPSFGGARGGEDVDAIGVSILSGAHMTLFPAILDELKSKNAGEIILFGGGIIPDDDKVELEKLGVGKVFTPGAPTEEAIKFLRTKGLAAAAKKAHRAASDGVVVVACPRPQGRWWREIPAWFRWWTSGASTR